jgi:hypothetical protein
MSYLLPLSSVPDVGNSTNIWNVGVLQRNYTVLYPRRLPFLLLSVIRMSYENDFKMRIRTILKVVNYKINN